jgi:hypothetical protein
LLFKKNTCDGTISQVTFKKKSFLCDFNHIINDSYHYISFLINLTIAVYFRPRRTFILGQGLPRGHFAQQAPVSVPGLPAGLPAGSSAMMFDTPGNDHVNIKQTLNC